MDLETNKKHKIKQFKIEADTIFQKSCILYGPTKSGKSTVMKYCLEVLKDKIPLVLLVSPTEQANPSFKGFIPEQCVLQKMTMDGPNKKEKEIDKVKNYLENLILKQEAATAIYKAANELESLEKLLSYCPSKSRHQYTEQIDILNDKKNTILKKINSTIKNDIVRKEMAERVASKVQETKVQIAKHILNQNNDVLQQMLVDDKIRDEDEIQSLKFKDSNPNIVLILDDCADDFKEYCKLKEFKSLFYKGRHYSITLLISCQDDTDLAPNLRKNAYVSIFTNASVAMANFTKKSNGYISDIAEEATSIIPTIYKEKYRFLVFERMTEQFYYFKTPSITNFRFGSDLMWKLCKDLQLDKDSYKKTNPYYRAMLS